jgi:hypothetical protein
LLVFYFIVEPVAQVRLEEATKYRQLGRKSMIERNLPSNEWSRSALAKIFQHTNQTSRSIFDHFISNLEDTTVIAHNDVQNEDAE